MSDSTKSYTAEEIREMNEAVTSLKGLQEEKETLREIREDREEYCEVSKSHSSLSLTLPSLNICVTLKVGRMKRGKD